MAITTTRNVLLITALGAGAIAAATILYLSLADDDQNPIRVKNKQLRIETEDKNAKWTKRASQEKWTLGIGNPTSATEYVVTAYGADPTCITPMRGDEVEIQYEVAGAAEKFTFRLVPIGSSANREPELEASTAMTADNAGPKVKKLRRTAETGSVVGAITSMKVSGGGTSSNCSFPKDRRVAVELCMHNCS